MRSSSSLFDFNKKSGISEWSLGHVAASVGNIEILELLSHVKNKKIYFRLILIYFKWVNVIDYQDI